MAKHLLIAGIVASAPLVAAAADEPAAASESPNFVTLDEIAAPIVGSDRIEGTLRVTLVIEAADAEAAADFADRLPELRAASLAATHEFSRLHASAYAAVNAEQLRHELTVALKRTHPRIAQVLVVELTARSS